MKVLDLFSGIGGFSLGLERAGMETVAFCEIDPFCRAVLRKHWPDVPIYEDVRELDASTIGPVDVICGGYPCQPFSAAGKRKGAEDDRHLWPEFKRLVAELRPTWVIGENVAGHISMGLDGVLSDLEAEGYTARTFVIPACALDAQHRRDRVWIVGHANSERQSQPQGTDAEQRGRFSNTSEDVADTNQRRCCGEGKRENQQQGRTETISPSEDVANPESVRQGRLSQRAPEAKPGPAQCSEDVSDSECIGCRQMEQPISGRAPKEGAASEVEHCGIARRWKGWPTEPAVGRVAYGVPRRVDRIRSLGNAVVPQIPEIIGHAIMEAAA